MHTYRNVFEEIFSTSGSEGNGDRRYYDNCLSFIRNAEQLHKTAVPVLTDRSAVFLFASFYRLPY